MAMAVAVVACDEAVGPQPVETRSWSSFRPPSVYAEWWASMAKCTGVTADFDRIRWFQAESIRWNGRDVLGLWAAPHDIALLNSVRDHEYVVKHEMLHDLLQAGWEAHGSPIFRKCEAAARRAAAGGSGVASGAAPDELL